MKHESTYRVYRDGKLYYTGYKYYSVLCQNLTFGAFDSVEEAHSWVSGKGSRYIEGFYSVVSYWSYRIGQ